MFLVFTVESRNAATLKTIDAVDALRVDDVTRDRSAVVDVHFAVAA